jgi:hypothetical protein
MKSWRDREEERPSSKEFMAGQRKIETAPKNSWQDRRGETVLYRVHGGKEKERDCLLKSS